jgi:hypothetical protein
MEGYPCTHLSTFRSESLELSFLEPNSSSGYKIHPSLMMLVQENSFLGLCHENPYPHVRKHWALMLLRENFLRYPFPGKWDLGTIAMEKMTLGGRVWAQSSIPVSPCCGLLLHQA